jgi:hypothetical protein
MKSLRDVVRLAAGFCAIGLLSAGCGVSVRELAGFPAQSDPSVTLRATEPKWLLIKNPRFGDVASEPEYVWVEEDKVPSTLKTLVFGKSSIIAPPEVVAKYGSPPGGGRVSPRQGGAYKVESLVPTVSPTTTAALPSSTRTDGGGALAPSLNRGYVVYVDTSRFVIDLAGGDGVKPGSVVSVRRDKISIVHPITGEMLGELDEEVASGKVSEVRDKFSVVDIENLPAGAQIKVKDRAVVR